MNNVFKLKKENTWTLILWFLAYAFVIPLICVMFMRYVPGFDKGVPNLLLFGIEAASPAIAAIAVTLQSGGVRSVLRFFHQNYINGFRIKYCLIGLLVPATMLTTAKLLTYITPYANPFFTVLPLNKIIIVLWALVAEELGWRGFLQNKLEQKFGGDSTPFILGIVWFAWHYHYFISGAMEVPLLVFFIGCIGESYGYYIITKLAKGNIVPASLWHFAGNLLINLYMLNPNVNGGAVLPYIITNMLFIVYIVAFILYRRFVNR